MITYEFTAGKKPPEIFSVPMDGKENMADFFALIVQSTPSLEVPLTLYIPFMGSIDQRDALRTRITTAITKMMVELNTPNEETQK
jgi:hypothetical protein